MPMSTRMPMIPAVSITTIAMTMMRDADDSDGDDDGNDDNEDNDNDDNDNDDDYREDNDEHEGDEDDENEEKLPFLAQKSEENECVFLGSFGGRWRVGRDAFCTRILTVFGEGRKQSGYSF